MTEMQMTETPPANPETLGCPVSGIGASGFEFVWDLGFEIWDFNRV
jgi:hypothetical protein